MTTLSTSSWLATFQHPDPKDAVEAALDDLGRLSARARELLRPVLSAALTFQRRGEARQVERMVPVSGPLAPATEPNVRKAYLELMVYVAPGRTVRRGEMTVEDHLARIEFLRSHIAGIEESIARHEADIALIQLHGVSCLDEVPEEGLSA